MPRAIKQRKERHETVQSESSWQSISQAPSRFQEYPSLETPIDI